MQWFQVGLLILQWLFALWQKRQAQTNEVEGRVEELQRKEIDLLDAIANKDGGFISRRAASRAARLHILLDFQLPKGPKPAA